MFQWFPQSLHKILFLSMVTVVASQKSGDILSFSHMLIRTPRDAWSKSWLRDLHGSMWTTSLPGTLPQLIYLIAVLTLIKEFGVELNSGGLDQVLTSWEWKNDSGADWSVSSHLVVLLCLFLIRIHLQRANVLCLTARNQGQIWWHWRTIWCLSQYSDSAHSYSTRCHALYRFPFEWVTDRT